MKLRAFRGLRPRPDLADKIPSPPYDVISSDEARELAADDPYSFLHVVRPEIDLDPSIDLYDDRVYAKARENFAAMIEDGWLVRDERPALYIYRLDRDGHEQTGIVAAAAIDDYIEDRIKKHEHTRPDKEQDRTRHVDTLGANAGPVFLTYRGVPELNALVRGLTRDAADVDFTAPDGVRHRLWVVDAAADVTKIEDMFAKVRRTYVADGHHRAASAVNVARRRREALDGPTGDEPSSYFLAVHFPAEQLQVLDYNRVVRDLNGLDPETLIRRIEEAGFEVRKKGEPYRPKFAETFGMYLDGSWYLLVAGSDVVDKTDAISRLDVSILTDHLLQPVLGIGDPRTDKRIDFVGGARGLEELERRVDSGEWAVAFSLYPTSIEQVMDVADAGRVMPPKSTWFEPKLRSGLVVYTFD
jgi:uncharacterized protein (DUF1015 family)